LPKERITKKARKARTPRGEAKDLARSYAFDYSRSRPNRFARALAKDAVVVVLDPDVALVFRTVRRVNSVVRASIAAMKKRRVRDVK